MSDRQRLLVLGATGLVGRRTIERAAFDPAKRLLAIARREISPPADGRVETIMADPCEWERAIASLAPHAVVCALGTTWRKAGEDEAAFRAVDQNLVLRCAHAALEAGTRQFMLVSSVGADRHSKNFYLRVKGEVEDQLGALKFERVDIVRPGLLRGPREADRRVKERVAIMASPVIDLFLHGKAARFRSIDASVVADGLLGLSFEKAAGRFHHDNQAIRRMATRYRRERAD